LTSLPLTIVALSLKVCCTVCSCQGGKKTAKRRPSVEVTVGRRLNSIKPLDHAEIFPHNPSSAKHGASLLAKAHLLMAGRCG